MVDSVNVDLGAMWIHDANPSNEVFELAGSLLELSRLQDYGSSQTYTADGAPYSDADTRASWEDLLGVAAYCRAHVF
jgi:hypothetical protein